MPAGMLGGMPQFDSQHPEQWGWPKGENADIVPFSFDGHSFPQGVARLAAPVFTSALEHLIGLDGFRLRESKGLDAGMWGYENRRIGSGGNWSFHAFGLAIDVNAPDNPQGTSQGSGPYALPPATGAVMRPLGVLWGGGPNGFGDPMHLEVHLSVAEANGWQSPGGGPFPQVTYPLPQGYYYGPFSGPRESISGSGRDDAPYRPGLAEAQLVLGVAADGYYGPDTAAAAAYWQAGHGLESDGLIGPLTWASLGL